MTGYAEAAQATERRRDDLFDEDHRRGGATKEPAAEATARAGDAAIRRMTEAHEGGFPEAGEKIGDRGTLTSDLHVQVNGKDVLVAAGTEVTVKEVLGERLVVTLPAKYGGQTARIASRSFKKGAAPTHTDPLVDPSKNPDPVNEYAPNAKYGEVKGVVAVKGAGEAHEIDPSDVEQGSLGDCYFVAQLAAQARVNPERIKNLIKDNGDGTYTVTLYLKDGWTRKPKQIVVDSQFPMEDGSVAYAKPGDRGADGPELWVALIEKAFAKHTGSYENIRGSKTRDGDVFAMMSGAASSSFSPASLGADGLLDRVGKAIAAGRAVSLGAKNKNTADETTQAAAKTAGVVLNHAYSVIGVDAKARTISLRNPWGVKHLENFPVESVLKFYDNVQIAAK